MEDIFANFGRLIDSVDVKIKEPDKPILHLYENKERNRITITVEFSGNKDLEKIGLVCFDAVKVKIDEDANPVKVIK